MKRVLAIAVLSSVLCGISLLALVLWANRQEMVLPTPAGPFAVGRTTVVWADEAIDPLAPQPETKRELFAWIWYPAKARPNQPRSDYLPPDWRAAIDQRSDFVLSNFINRNAAKIQAHSLSDADVAVQGGPYPVVIIRAGLAAMIGNYTVLAESLASYGYIVVGFDAPYRTWVVSFPDGRAIARTRENNADAFGAADAEKIYLKLQNAWTADVGFALDKLTELNTAGKFAGRLDMSKVGVFGHSLGGATALQFCHDDLRCKAVIDIDGAPRGSVVAEGLKQPTLIIASDHGDMSQGPDQAVDADLRRILNFVPPDSRIRIAIRGSNHYMFSDGAVTRNPVMMRIIRAIGIVDIEGARQLEITNYYVHSFFDTYLKGAANSDLAAGSSRYSEVE